MRHVLFTVEDERFAVPLAKVREVVLPRPCSRIPRAPAAMLGIMNLRGRVVSVVHLGALLGLRGDRQPGLVLLLDRGRRDLGLAVCAVTGIVPLEARVRAPDGAPPFVSGVAEDERGAVTLLDPDALDAQVAALFQHGGRDREAGDD